MGNKKSHTVAVLGGGSFGTAIANMIAANNQSTTLWLRSEATAQSIRETGENAAYLPGYKLHEDLIISTDLEQAIGGCDTVFFAVPSSAFRSLAKIVSPFLKPGTVLVSMAKGVEAESFMLPSQVLEQEISHCPVGVISGPNLAKEIAQFEITATVVASDNDDLCLRVQALLASKYFRIYANPDRYGVELAGALKNIYAIVSGIAAALTTGQNTKSVVLTRSLAEMSRFAVHLGANPLTFLGLSGVGDLYVTCTSPLSRNYQIGLAIGQGKSLDQAIKEVGQVAEGINTTKLVKEKADYLGIYMPLASALYATLFEQRSIKESLSSMMLAEQNTDVEFMVKPNDR
ncbi:MAG: NAD(P)H-dependent glycerol-3-phosphate dehydrogenase [Porticoccaceae bacterium]|nr:NAD(P)H-dependent glycerol-3-phosphate dehydrogenase [Porticoccaceae bacterium]MDG1307122.1 NAD(P)H-dependent glycerol-3-phosphate dehydrogenase [Porticoccaceae bacterium]